MQMTSNKGYLIRALHEWILDNGCTPYLAVDANYPGVQVPVAFVKDGQIVLNISPTAVRHLIMDNLEVSFSARFSGTPHNIHVPISAVAAIYAQENGQGMAFQVDMPPEPPQGKAEAKTEGAKKKGPAKPSLKVIK